MSPISLLTSVAGIEACLFAAGERADRPGDGLERPHGPAHHKQRRDEPDQHPRDSEHDALPFVVPQRPGEIVGQHAAPARAEVAQQIGDPADLLPFGAQHFLVELGDLASVLRDRQRSRRRRLRPRSAAPDRRSAAPACARAARSADAGSCASKRRRNLVLRPEQLPRDSPVRHRRRSPLRTVRAPAATPRPVRRGAQSSAVTRSMPSR